jgi:hypothetical protein
MNATAMIVAAIGVFAAGVVCGAWLVHRFRHVTRKELHQSMLASLREKDRAITEHERTIELLEAALAAAQPQPQPQPELPLPAIPEADGRVSLRVYRENPASPGIEDADEVFQGTSPTKPR